MSIILKTIVIDGVGAEHKFVAITTKESFLEFQKLIQAGSELHPNWSPAVKQFVDMVTNGKVLQDYYSQAQMKPEGVYESAIFNLSNMD